MIEVNAKVTYVKASLRVGTANRVFRVLFNRLVDREEAKRILNNVFMTTRYDLIYITPYTVSWEVLPEDTGKSLDLLIKDHVQEISHEEISFIIGEGVITA